MKPTQNGHESMEFGFTLLTPGRKLVKLTSGVEKYPKDDGTFTIGFPFEVIQGDADEAGKKLTDFVYVNPGDEKSLNKSREHVATILVCCGMAEKFEGNFPANDYFDDPVIEAYKVQLIDKKPMWVTVEHRQYKGKDGEEKTQIQVRKIEKYVPAGAVNAGGNNAKKESAPATAAAVAGAGKSEW